MNASHGRDAVASTVPSAVIRLPLESITLPVPRTVSDGAGDGVMAALIVVMGTKAAKAFGAKGDCRFQIETDPENRGGMP